MLELFVALLISTVPALLLTFIFFQPVKEVHSRGKHGPTFYHAMECWFEPSLFFWNALMCVLILTPGIMAFIAAPQLSAFMLVLVPCGICIFWFVFGGFYLMYAPLEIFLKDPYWNRTVSLISGLVIFLVVVMVYFFGLLADKGDARVWLFEAMLACLLMIALKVRLPSVLREPLRRFLLANYHIFTRSHHYFVTIAATFGALAVMGMLASAAISTLASVLSLVVVFGAMLCIYLIYGREHEVRAGNVGNTEPPEDIPPSLASLIFSNPVGVPNGREIYADMIYLVSRKKLDVVANKEGIVVKSRLGEGEKNELVAMLMEKQESGNRIDWVELKNLEKAYGERLRSQAAQILAPYFEMTGYRILQKLCIFLACSAALFGAVMMITTPKGGVGPFNAFLWPIVASFLIETVVIVLILVGGGFAMMGRFTPEGRKRYLEWMAYKETLKNSTIKNRSYHAVELWDYHLAYAIAFGVATKALKEIKSPHSATVDEYWEKAYKKLEES